MLIFWQTFVKIMPKQITANNRDEATQEDLPQLKLSKRRIKAPKTLEKTNGGVSGDWLREGPWPKRLKD
jgi:hypothetical protein